MTRKKREFSRFAIAADAIGVTHLIVGSISILLGEVTGIFSKFSYEHGGIAFVLGYLDAPVYYFVQPFVPMTDGDRTYVILAAMAVCVLASVVYGFLAFLILKFAVSLFKSGN